MELNQFLNNRKNVGVALVAYFELLDAFILRYNPNFGLKRSEEDIVTGNIKFHSCSQLFGTLQGINLRQCESILVDLKTRLGIAQEHARDEADFGYAAKWQKVADFFAEFLSIVESGVSVLRELEAHLQNARDVNTAE